MFENLNCFMTSKDSWRGEGQKKERSRALCGQIELQDLRGHMEVQCRA
jgi:hypothetical protein